jgi:hypothetical protein
VTETLPPRPNPSTGEPRPPQAPRSTAFGELRRRSAKLARYPQAPEGRGPVLEWYHGAIDSIWMSSLFVSAFCFVTVTVGDFGFGWMGTWQLWALVLAPAPLWAAWQIFIAGRWGISAGADWLAVRGGYVDLYELTEIKIVASRGGLAWALKLADEKGTKLSINIRDLQANQALWNLTYNGIRCSVQRGSAKTNQRALDQLGLR